MAVMPRWCLLCCCTSLYRLLARYAARPALLLLFTVLLDFERMYGTSARRDLPVMCYNDVVMQDGSAEGHALLHDWLAILAGQYNHHILGLSADTAVQVTGWACMHYNSTFSTLLPP